MLLAFLTKKLCPWAKYSWSTAPGEQFFSRPCGLTFLLRRQAQRWISPLGINRENKKEGKQGCLCPKDKTQSSCKTQWEVLPLTHVESFKLGLRLQHFIFSKIFSWLCVHVGVRVSLHLCLMTIAICTKADDYRHTHLLTAVARILHVCAVCCRWQLLITNLCVDCRLIVCERDVERAYVCWLQGVCMRVPACVCWLQSNADQMKQEIGFLAPSIISRFLSSLPFLLLWFTHFLCVVASVCLFSFSYALFIARFSFSRTLYFLLWICHWTVEFHTQHSYASQFQVTFCTFSFFFSLCLLTVKHNSNSKVNERHFEFIKITFDWFLLLC